MNEQIVSEKPDLVIEILRRDNILDEASIEQLIARHGETGASVLSILRNDGLIDQDQLTRLTAGVNTIEFVNLTPDMIDPVAVKLVSFELARKYNLIPVRIDKDCLYIAMSSPLNLAVRDTITTKTGYRVIPLAATVDAVAQAIGYHFSVESVTKQDIVAMRLKSTATKDDKSKRTKSQASKIAEAPIVRLVDSILTGAVDVRASDIHIEPQEPDMKVRYRVDGILLEALDVPASVQREVISHIKILAKMDISEKRIPQDGHIKLEYHEKEYDLRVSTLPATSGEKIVIRVLDSNVGLVQLNELVTDAEDYEKLASLIKKPYGMILLTGPTGSGKTTTLYSMIQALNSADRNIVTVEDPVEYRLRGITQVQVSPEIDMTFATCLRSILRQDPDVILIGEIRDLETAEIAISAALTGHLVLSTLHTNDAAGAISRLINLGVSSFQLASSLLGIVAQRLVRTVCPRCSESYKPTEKELSELLAIENDEAVKEKVRSGVLAKGKGCNFCRDTGYHGRKGLLEILEMAGIIRNMVVERASDDQIKSCAVMQGMKTLRMQGIGQVIEGATTIDELARVVNLREE